MKCHDWFVTWIVALGAVLIASGAVASQEVQDTMTMNSEVYQAHKKSLVTFSHKKHSEEYKIACADCHHVYEGDKNVWKQGDVVQKCGACHKETGKPEKGMSKKDKIAKFHKEALHANCVGCHKKQGKKELAKCTACHPKKEK